MPRTPPYILSLGGSLLVPDEVDTRFVSVFRQFIVSQVEAGRRFIIVVGGGRTARRYIDAADAVAGVNDEDKDWLGIHSTRLNAHFLRTVLREYAHPKINTNPHHLDDFYSFEESILVAAGWRPGNSTDYIAVILAKYFDASVVINLSNIDYVYDVDPRTHPEAEPRECMTWPDFRALVGDEWSPGLSAPFDPVAARLAEERNMEVVIMNGNDLDNVARYLNNEPSRGTVIRS